MEIILEIIKYTIPGLIVFLATYFILRQYLNAQYQLKSLEVRAKYSQDAIPLKLQAYERLLLFCERISIPNLIFRLKTNAMTSVELKNAMMISVQKEYEHNMAQQLYVSQKLWDIITLAKNDTIAHIGQEANTISELENANALSTLLLNNARSKGKSTIALTINAIKEEAKIILNV
ncbi:MAG: hypothetical protein HKO66_05660 [Saprospiraceae bacterium]|nr:hypothetical protein [Bacteroidia bacterium]NNE14408.1 hypothetical protein [Saprospiraceae bacterium]NNL91696.1 hypothetical protein [Saprospiraceae bacterium]